MQYLKNGAQNRPFLLELAGIVILTVLLLVNAFIVYPTPQDLANIEPGDIVLSLRIAIGSGLLFPTTLASILTLVVIVREACTFAANIDRGEGSAVADVRPGPFLDGDAILLVARVVVLYILGTLIWFLFVGSPNDSLVILLLWIYTFFRMLPLAAQRWCSKEESHRLMGFVRRSVLAGIPLTLLPSDVFPVVLEGWSSDDVILVYPLFLSFAEYLVVSVLYKDAVVAGYSDDSLSITARYTVAVIEASRIGMLVVVTNSLGGSIGGLINATVLGLVSESLARNNLISISSRWIRYAFRWHWSKFVSTVLCKPWSAPSRPQANKMGRFKCVYLGVKLDTEYWGVFMLILIKWLGWGYGGPLTPAMDPNTGKLLDVLDSSWDVIGVVALGELVGDLLAGLIGWFMRRYAPSDLHVNVPVITPGDAGLVVVMWLNVGGFYMNGIASMGVLSDSLLKVES